MNFNRQTLCRPQKDGLGWELTCLPHIPMVEKSEVTRGRAAGNRCLLPGSAGAPHTPASVLGGSRGNAEGCWPPELSAVRLGWLLATDVVRIAAPSRSALPRALASSSSRGRPLSVYVTTGERPPGICQWHRTVSGGGEGTKLFPQRTV